MKACNSTGNIKFIYDKEVSPIEVLEVYVSVGWNYRPLRTIQRSLKNSLLVLGAYDGDKLVGIARATGDGVLNATLWDVAVKKEYQSRGIGKFMINSMLTKLYDCGIPLVTLYTKCTNAGFYSKLGFESNSNQVVGMYKHKN